MCEIQSVWKELKKLWKEGEGIKCLELFFPPTDLWPLRKCFHVLCLTRSRAKKENILSSKPHATDSFWGQINQPRVSDHVTLFGALFYTQHILFQPPPPPPQSPTPSIPTLSHTHARAHSEFPFPVRQITWTGNGVLQRNMLRQENRKESSRVSNMKCSRSRGKPRGRGGGPFSKDKEVTKDSWLHFLLRMFISITHSVVASMCKGTFQSLMLWTMHTDNISLPRSCLCIH